MHVTGRVDIGTSFVDLTVNDEAGGVDGSITTTESIAFFIDADHVRRLEHGKMYAVWIDPESVWLDGVCEVVLLSTGLCPHSRQTPYRTGLPLKLICPLPPSAYPNFAKIRNAPAMC